MKSRNSRSGAPTRLADEFAVIAKYFAPLATSKGALGLLDDCALLRLPKKHDLVLTTDAIVEGVHFLPEDPPDTVAQKALRVNLSDLAAKGAVPIGYLMVLLLPSHCTTRWVAGFSAGLKRDQKAFQVSLLGGDTSRTPGPLTVAIAAFGSAPAGKMIERRGAKHGDLVFVSGSIGDAGAGLDILKKKLAASRAKKFLVSRYRVPTPRLALGRELLSLASASVDVSDGLVADLGHIARASGVHIDIDAMRVPLSQPYCAQVGESLAAAAQAATSGDDYELAFTCPPARGERLTAAVRRSGGKVTCIGRVSQGRGVTLLGPDGDPIPLRRPGYTHF
jgi:thiamine-monophosphate kinase